MFLQPRGALLLLGQRRGTGVVSSGLRPGSLESLHAGASPRVREGSPFPGSCSCSSGLGVRTSHTLSPATLSPGPSHTLIRLTKISARLLSRQCAGEQLQMVNERTGQGSAVQVIRELQIKSAIYAFMAYQIGRDEKVTKSTAGMSAGTRSHSLQLVRIYLGEIITDVYTGAHSSVASSKRKTGNILGLGK